jgi:hypothetical protein
MGICFKHVKQTLGKGRWATSCDEAKRAHGEAEAQRLLVRGLTALSFRPEDLSCGPKEMAAKQALAWWLSLRITVARRWASERLSTGDESRVTQAIRRVKAGDDPELRSLRQKLERAGENED